MEINLKADDVIIVIGRRGTGKSVLADDLLQEFDDEGHKTFCYDTVRDHPNFKRECPEDACLEDFEIWAKKIYAEGNMVVLIEEIDMLCTSSMIGPNFKKLVSLGRHQNVGLIMTYRRIADAHKLPPSQAHHFFIFRTHLPNDISYLRTLIGNDVDLLPTLEDFHFLHWHNGKSQICEPVPYGGK